MRIFEFACLSRPYRFEALDAESFMTATLQHTWKYGCKSHERAVNQQESCRPLMLSRDRTLCKATNFAMGCLLHGCFNSLHDILFPFKAFTSLILSL